jgi:hypothetical protein
MTRRTFFRISAGCGASITLASLVGVAPSRWLSTPAAWLVAMTSSPEQRLADHFHYLRLDAAGIEKYFADYQLYREGLYRHRPLAPDVYTRYLLSTDFLKNGADESRLVSYIGFYEPAVTACHNPCATFDDSTQ